MILIFNSCISIQRAWVCFMTSYCLTTEWTFSLCDQNWPKSVSQFSPLCSNSFTTPHSHMENKLLSQDHWTNVFFSFSILQFYVVSGLMVIHNRKLAIFYESCHILATTCWNLLSKFDDFKTSSLKIWLPLGHFFPPKNPLYES